MDKEKRSNTTSQLRPEPAARTIEFVKNHVDSADLFVDTREIVITHGGDSYRLRLTAQNKLILTK